MKVVNMREAQVTLSALVRQAQQAPVCFTRYGKPLAIMLGVQGQELAAILRKWDPELSREPSTPRTPRRRRRQRQT